MSDITLKAGGGYFIYKTGAVIINENKVLVVKNENYPYYYSVGGRVRFGETSQEAVIREAKEETGIDFEIDRLLFVSENFFIGDFLNNSSCHEIGFFYLMKPSSDIKNINCDSNGIDGGKETLHWLSLDKLREYEIYPNYFKTELKELTNEVKHFIIKDRKAVRV